MPKMKIRKSLAKRFRITNKGKVLFRGSHVRHLKRKKSKSNFLSWTLFWLDNIFLLVQNIRGGVLFFQTCPLSELENTIVLSSHTETLCFR